MDKIAMSVAQNIRLYVDIKKSEIWVRRTHLQTAEEEFDRLREEGKIISAEFRPAWSCNGSANFLMHYPH